MTVAKTPETPTRSLHRKLAQVMYEAKSIPKNGTAPREMGGYSFVQVGDAADYIRKALAEKVITMMPTSVQVVGQHEGTTAKGGTITTVELITEWTLTDGESGESITIMSYGAGADVGDKYSGKASTSAMKYALLTGFLLSTGEDSEAGNTPERLAPTKEEDERPELLGNFAKSGKVAKGTAEAYKLEWREGPDGHAIGFRVDIEGPDERSVPQVLVTGIIGEALYLATGGDPKALLGKRISFKGKLYGIHQPPPRKTYFRLIIGEHPDAEYIETPDVRIPALPADVVSPLRAAPETTETPAESPEAESVLLPFELDADERLMVGGGKPG